MPNEQHLDMSLGQHILPTQALNLRFTGDTRELGELAGIPDFFANIHHGLEVYSHVRQLARKTNQDIPLPPSHIFIIAGESGSGKRLMSGQIAQYFSVDNTPIKRQLDILGKDGMRTTMHYSSLATIRDRTQRDDQLIFTPDSSHRASDYLGRALLKQLDEPLEDTTRIEVREAVLIPPPLSNTDFDLGYAGTKRYLAELHRRNGVAEHVLHVQFPEVPESDLHFLLPFQLHAIGLLDDRNGLVPNNAERSRRELTQVNAGDAEMILKRHKTRLRRGSLVDATSYQIAANSGGPDAPQRSRSLTNKYIVDRIIESSNMGMLVSEEEYRTEIMQALASPDFRRTRIEALLRQTFSDLGISPIDILISANEFTRNRAGATLHHGLLENITSLPHLNEIQ